MKDTTQLYWRDDTLPFLELRSTYDSRQSYKPHFHPTLSFGAVIAGKTRANCGGREFLLGEGDLVLIAPHVVHSCNPIAGEARSYHMLYLNEAWCVENVAALQVASLVNGSCVIRSPELFASYLEFVVALPNLNASDATRIVQGLLVSVAEAAVPLAPSMKTEPLAERIKHALLDNITARITLDDLAIEFGCRKETLIRVFRRAFHTTPYAFLNNVRVEHAKQRLKLGQDIADVAVDLGFSDQAHLHRAFMNFTASTPGQYRRARSATINIRQ
ncbi:MAG TPA: AraC family transcriptional regulator [Steroidobacteraceae bacterium]|nr:AraC family transcriptional regulator [Steroidobacteraceae bacterium]